MSVSEYMKGRLTEDQVKESIAEHKAEYQNLVTSQIVPQLKHLLGLMMQVEPSKQIQLSIQDLESINLHMVDLIQNGKKEPLEEIPLEESDEEDDFDFGAAEEDEIQFADDPDEEESEEETDEE